MNKKTAAANNTKTGINSVVDSVKADHKIGQSEENSVSNTEEYKNESHEPSELPKAETKTAVTRHPYNIKTKSKLKGDASNIVE